MITATTYDRKGRVIAVGKNSYVKSHPRQSQYAQEAGYPERVTLHAEIDAIIKSRTKKIDKIKIERYGKSGRPLLAKPCPVCELAIAKAGIRFVEYTVGE